MVFPSSCAAHARARPLGGHGGCFGTGTHDSRTVRSLRDAPIRRRSHPGQVSSSRSTGISARIRNSATGAAGIGADNRDSRMHQMVEALGDLAARNPTIRMDALVRVYGLLLAIPADAMKPTCEYLLRAPILDAAVEAATDGDAQQMAAACGCLALMILHVEPENAALLLATMSDVFPAGMPTLLNCCSELLEFPEAQIQWAAQKFILAVICFPEPLLIFQSSRQLACNVLRVAMRALLSTSLSSIHPPTAHGAPCSAHTPWRLQGGRPFPSDTRTEASLTQELARSLPLLAPVLHGLSQTPDAAWNSQQFENHLRAVLVGLVWEQQAREFADRAPRLCAVLRRTNSATGAAAADSGWEGVKQRAMGFAVRKVVELAGEVMHSTMHATTYEFSREVVDQGAGGLQVGDAAEDGAEAPDPVMLQGDLASSALAKQLEGDSKEAKMLISTLMSLSNGNGAAPEIIDASAANFTLPAGAGDHKTIVVTREQLANWQSRKGTQRPLPRAGSRGAPEETQPGLPVLTNVLPVGASPAQKASVLSDAFPGSMGTALLQHWLKDIRRNEHTEPRFEHLSSVAQSSFSSYLEALSGMWDFCESTAGNREWSRLEVRRSLAEVFLPPVAAVLSSAWSPTLGKAVFDLAPELFVRVQTERAAEAGSKMVGSLPEDWIDEEGARAWSAAQGLLDRPLLRSTLLKEAVCPIPSSALVPALCEMMRLPPVLAQDSLLLMAVLETQYDTELDATVGFMNRPRTLPSVPSSLVLHQFEAQLAAVDAPTALALLQNPLPRELSRCVPRQQSMLGWARDRADRTLSALTNLWAADTSSGGAVEWPEFEREEWAKVEAWKLELATLADPENRSAAAALAAWQARAADTRQPPPPSPSLAAVEAAATALQGNASKFMTFVSGTTFPPHPFSVAALSTGMQSSARSMQVLADEGVAEVAEFAWSVESDMRSEMDRRLHRWEQVNASGATGDRARGLEEEGGGLVVGSRVRLRAAPGVRNTAAVLASAYVVMAERVRREPVEAVETLQCSPGIMQQVCEEIDDARRQEFLLGRYAGSPLPPWHHPLLLCRALADAGQATGGASLDLLVRSGALKALRSFTMAILLRLDAARKASSAALPGDVAADSAPVGPRDFLDTPLPLGDALAYCRSALHILSALEPHAAATKPSLTSIAFTALSLCDKLRGLRSIPYLYTAPIGRFRLANCSATLGPALAAHLPNEGAAPKDTPGSGFHPLDPNHGTDVTRVQDVVNAALAAVEVELRQRRAGTTSAGVPLVLQDKTQYHLLLKQLRELDGGAHQAVSLLAAAVVLYPNLASKLIAQGFLDAVMRVLISVLHDLRDAKNAHAHMEAASIIDAMPVNDTQARLERVAAICMQFFLAIASDHRLPLQAARGQVPVGAGTRAAAWATAEDGLPPEQVNVTLAARGLVGGGTRTRRLLHAVSKVPHLVLCSVAIIRLGPGPGQQLAVELVRVLMSSRQARLEAQSAGIKALLMELLNSGSQQVHMSALDALQKLWAAEKGDQEFLRRAFKPLDPQHEVMRGYTARLRFPLPAPLMPLTSLPPGSPALGDGGEVEALAPTSPKLAFMSAVGSYRDEFSLQEGVGDAGLQLQLEDVREQVKQVVGLALVGEGPDAVFEYVYGLMDSEEQVLELVRISREAPASLVLSQLYDHLEGVTRPADVEHLVGPAPDWKWTTRDVVGIMAVLDGRVACVRVTNSPSAMRWPTFCRWHAQRGRTAQDFVERAHCLCEATLPADAASDSDGEGGQQEVEQASTGSTGLQASPVVVELHISADDDVDDKDNVALIPAQTHATVSRSTPDAEARRLAAPADSKAEAMQSGSAASAGSASVEEQGTDAPGDGDAGGAVSPRQLELVRGFLSGLKDGDAMLTWFNGILEPSALAALRPLFAEHVENWFSLLFAAAARARLQGLGPWSAGVVGWPRQSSHVPTYAAAHTAVLAHVYGQVSQVLGATDDTDVVIEQLEASVSAVRDIEHAVWACHECEAPWRYRWASGLAVRRDAESTQLHDHFQRCKFGLSRAAMHVGAAWRSEEQRWEGEWTARTGLGVQLLRDADCVVDVLRAHGLREPLACVDVEDPAGSWGPGRDDAARGQAAEALAGRGPAGSWLSVLTLADAFRYLELLAARAGAGGDAAEDFESVRADVMRAFGLTELGTVRGEGEWATLAALVDLKASSVPLAQPADDGPLGGVSEEAFLRSLLASGGAVADGEGPGGRGFAGFGQLTDALPAADPGVIGAGLPPRVDAHRATAADVELDPSDARRADANDASDGVAVQVVADSGAELDRVEAGEDGTPQRGLPWGSEGAVNEALDEAVRFAVFGGQYNSEKAMFGPRALLTVTYPLENAGTAAISRREADQIAAGRQDQQLLNWLDDLTLEDLMPRLRMLVVRDANLWLPVIARHLVVFMLEEEADGADLAQAILQDNQLCMLLSTLLFSATVSTAREAARVYEATFLATERACMAHQWADRASSKHLFPGAHASLALVSALWRVGPEAASCRRSAAAVLACLVHNRERQEEVAQSALSHVCRLFRESDDDAETLAMAVLLCSLCENHGGNQRGVLIGGVQERLMQLLKHPHVQVKMVAMRLLFMLSQNLNNQAALCGLRDLPFHLADAIHAGNTSTGACERHAAACALATAANTFTYQGQLDTEYSQLVDEPMARRLGYAGVFVAAVQAVQHGGPLQQACALRLIACGARASGDLRAHLLALGAVPLLWDALHSRRLSQEDLDLVERTLGQLGQDEDSLVVTVSAGVQPLQRFLTWVEDTRVLYPGRGDGGGRGDDGSGIPGFWGPQGNGDDDDDDRDGDGGIPAYLR